ncbi:MAG: rhomboid family intramembrane serine protease [Pseudomonadales bacterium]|nr:rhomboid family intramembrane serine protease [Pseudomonadales bacterium]
MKAFLHILVTKIWVAKATSLVAAVLVAAYLVLATGLLSSTHLLFPDELTLQALLNQPWRFITPIVLHHDLQHLAINLICWLEFSSQIESRHSSVMLLNISLLIAFTSNSMEFLLADNRFGGLSGVALGLGAFIGTKVYLYKESHWRFPPVYSLALIVLLLSDLIGLTTNQSIYCHLFGVISGAFLASVTKPGLKENSDAV